MQEIKFKLKRTEIGNVEIVPVEDGVEIIVRYGEKKSTEAPKKGSFKFSNKSDDGSSYEDNLNVLKRFCGKMKNEEDVDLKQLKSFYNFYSERAEDWKGRMDCEKLFNNWMEKAR